jgi:hypothetical protein
MNFKEQVDRHISGMAKEATTFLTEDELLPVTENAQNFVLKGSEYNQLFFSWQIMTGTVFAALISVYR